MIDKNIPDWAHGLKVVNSETAVIAPGKRVESLVAPLHE